MEETISKISGDTIIEYYLSKTDGGKDEKAKTHVGKQIRLLFPPKKSVKLGAVFFSIIWGFLSLVVACMFLSEGFSRRYDFMLLSVGILTVLQWAAVVSFLSTAGEASIYDMLCIYMSKHGDKLPSGEEASKIISENATKQEEVKLLEKQFASKGRCSQKTNC